MDRGSFTDKSACANSEIMVSITRESDCKYWNGKEMLKLEYQVEQFKRLLMNTFSEHCNSRLNTLKVQLLDQILEGLLAFGIPSVLHASPFAQYNGHLKHVYNQKSKRKDTCMSKTVMMLEGVVSSLRLTQSHFARKEKEKQKYAWITSMTLEGGAGRGGVEWKNT